MAVAFYGGWRQSETWRAALAAALPGWAVRHWPDDVADGAAITYAVVWQPLAGMLGSLPNLKGILALGAGIDGLASDPSRPPAVPVVRLIDPNLTRGMVEYVTWAVLRYYRRLHVYDAQHRNGNWRHLGTTAAPETCRVGILGLGELGGACAERLSRFGFDVAGWRRSAAAHAKIATYHGAAGLQPFLARTDILVCMLPLTETTRGILNRDSFAALPTGAKIINVGRGAHLVEADLLAALDRGHIGHATLDVFDVEPLPADHRFWTHPGVTLTPHIASSTDPASAMPLIADNIRRLESGAAPIGLIDPLAGY